MKGSVKITFGPRKIVKIGNRLYVSIPSRLRKDVNVNTYYKITLEPLFTMEEHVEE